MLVFQMRALLLVLSSCPVLLAAANLLGIDVSHYQGAIDWPTVAKSGTFASLFLRVGHALQCETQLCTP
jgi:hypothetical protein